MRDPQEVLNAFEAQQRVALVIAQLSPRVCFADRVRLIRELEHLYQSAGLDVLVRDRLGAVKQERTTNLGKGRKSWQLWSLRNHDDWAKAGQTKRMDAYNQHQAKREQGLIAGVEFREEPADPYDGW